MILKEFGWERFYKGSNPRGNLQLSDYCREKAAEMAKEEERKLESIMDKVADGQATIQEQAAQMETMYNALEKGAEAEKQLISRIEDKSAELDEVKQDLTDKKKEAVRQEERLEDLRGNVDALAEKAKLYEAMVDYFKDTDAGERERAYFEQIVELKYENGKLRQQNEELKAENRTLRTKLEKAYDFMRQFTIGGVNILEKFLRSIG